MKKYKPTSKSRRNMTGINYRKIITTNVPEKSLVSGFKRGVGRNKQGKITTRHKGGGHKRLYRDVDFTYDKVNVPFTIKSVEYDPNRSGFIGLAQYKDGEKRYVLLHNTVKVGETFIVSETAPMTVGNRMPVGNMIVGTFVYNVELKHKGGAKVARSGGDYAEILAKDGGYVDIKLPSTEVRKIPANAWASIGEVSNNEIVWSISAKPAVLAGSVFVQLSVVRLRIPWITHTEEVKAARVVVAVAPSQSTVSQPVRVRSLAEPRSIQTSLSFAAGRLGKSRNKSSGKPELLFRHSAY
jgi:large subunit ribosomal protein L2